MFGYSKDSLWEARIADLKHEHNRTVDTLVAWIEQLQSQVGAYQQPVAVGGNYPTTGTQQPPAATSVSMYVSEEEGALDDALEMGLITKDQYNEELERINAHNSLVT